MTPLVILAAICEPEGVNFERDPDGTIVLRLKTEMVPSVNFVLECGASELVIIDRVRDCLSHIEERIVSYLLNKRTAV